jgi:quinol monooxygenase YgiN
MGRRVLRPYRGSAQPHERGLENRRQGWRRCRAIGSTGVLGGLGYNPAPMAKRETKRSKSRQRSRTASRKSPSRKSKDGKLPKEAVTIVVLLKSREGQEPLLEAELRALVGPTRKEDGCITYDLHRGDAPSSFLLHEVWESREAHRLHTQTPHFIRWNARKDALLVSRDATFWSQIV